jgi:hypothetical protein
MGHQEPTQFNIIPLIVAAILIFIQFVVTCIAYWAFKQRKSCDYCYDSAGVPNCPGTQPVRPPVPRPRRPPCEGTRSTLRDAGSEVLFPSGGRCPQPQCTRAAVVLASAPFVSVGALHCACRNAATRRAPARSESLNCRCCWHPKPRALRSTDAQPIPQMQMCAPAAAGQSLEMAVMPVSLLPPNAAAADIALIAAAYAAGLAAADKAAADKAACTNTAPSSGFQAECYVKPAAVVLDASSQAKVSVAGHMRA